jgi:TolB-like protein
MTRQALARIPSLSVIPYGSLESHLREKDLTRLDLTDTSVALKTAERLKVDYILTGSIIEMPSSVVLFARILNRKTEAVDSVAQLILPLNDEVRALLHRLHR